MADVKVTCFSCGTGLSFPAVPGRRDECSNCRADVHVCKNCQHYDKNVYNECREPQADVVKEKERANFCDFFSPAGKSAAGNDRQADLMAAAEALFKKK